MQPEEPTPHHWFGVFNLTAGYLEAFGDEIRTAYELNPAHAGIASVSGLVRFCEGDYEAAREQLEVAESMGAWYVSGAVLPMVLYEMGRPEEALAATRRYHERRIRTARARSPLCGLLGKGWLAGSLPAGWRRIHLRLSRRTVACRLRPRGPQSA